MSTLSRPLTAEHLVFDLAAQVAELRRDDAAVTYAGWLEDEGFEVERSDKKDNIVLLAQRDQTVAFLFFQDDPDRKGGTMMVLQHMEE